MANRHETTISPSSVSIRPFVPGDQEAARRLILEGLGQHFGFIDKTLNPDLDDIRMSYIECGALFVVAEFGGEVAGTGALIREAPGISRIVRMSVSAKCRRRGFGRELVSFLLDAARRRGDRRVVIETNENWHDAIGLYLACGFHEDRCEDGSVHLVLDLP